MISLKATFITGVLSLTLFLGYSQEQILKIKDKNFIGDWFSKDNYYNFKEKPVLVFFKNQDFKDSLSTYFKIYKDEALKIIMKASNKTTFDTLSTKWVFVPQSKT